MSPRFCNVSIWRMKKRLVYPLPPYVKLSAQDNPTSDDEKVEMARISYTLAVGSLMYAMVTTCTNISFELGVVSKYIANLGKKHWEATKVS